MKDYLIRVENPKKDEILWNVPEVKQGKIAIIGGNAQNFRVAVKTVEYLASEYPLQEVRLILPDALKLQLPPLENAIFLASTDTGSFAKTEELIDVINAADYSLLIGDFSKNTITARAVSGACEIAEKPLVATRDVVDLLASEQAEKWLMNPNIALVATMPQLIKILKVIYYPRVLIISQSLVQVAETLHKFTLSYPVKILTLHDGQILIAENGMVSVMDLAKTNYSPLALWSGDVAAKIAALNLYNPRQFTAAALTALVA